MAWKKYNPAGMSNWGFERPFNMDQLFTERIDNRLNELDKASIENNQVLRYRILFTIFINTHFKYLDKVEGIKAKFKKIKEQLNKKTDMTYKQAQLQHQTAIISLAEILLDELEFDIINLLYENDLICLKVKTRLPPEVEVERDYR